MAEDEPPFQLFDRARVGHPWERAFREMRAMAPDRRWAIAANWRMDHRVSLERETQDLLGFAPFASAMGGNEWWSARAQYFKNEICNPISSRTGAKISAYGRSPNAGNLLYVKATGFDRLVHVGSFKSILWRVVDTARMSGRLDEISMSFEEITGGLLLPTAPDGFDRAESELVSTLVRLGPEVVKRVAGFLVNRLGDREPPWWACYEEEVDGLLNAGDSKNLCAALGLGHLIEEETHLLVWVYRSDEVLPLYRPTVVEANDSAYHFPSPPDYDWGIAMPLSPGLPVCREVLHRPLRGTLAGERCTGSILFLRTSMAKTSEELASLRAAHWEKLLEEFYTDLLELWLQRNPEPQ